MDRARLVTLLDARLSQGLASRFRDLVASQEDATAAEYMAANESTMVFHAKELLLSRVGRGGRRHKWNIDVSLSGVSFGNSLVSSITHHACVGLWSTGRELCVRGFQEFAEHVVRRAVDSLPLSPLVTVSKKFVFQSLNKMTGNEPLLSLKRSIDEAVSDSKREALATGALEDAVAQFVAKSKKHMVQELKRFIRDRLSHDVVTEADMLQCWRENAVAQVMDE